MKNIILTIAMFILTITAQAQIIKVDSCYQFTHDTSISTYEAQEKNKSVDYGWVYGSAKYEINEDQKMIVYTFFDNGVEKVQILDIIKVVKEGCAKQYFFNIDNKLSGDVILTKDKEHKNDMISNIYIT